MYCKEVQMNKAIEILMDEHRLIEKVLGSLMRRVKDARLGKWPSRGEVADYATFFREFADKCHHGKEEERLFKEMTASGFPSENGPIAVMLHEHEQGRASVRRLTEIGSGSGDWTEEEKDGFMENAEGFFHLLTQHIQKEDTILYPMAENVIGRGSWDGIADSFEIFEKEEIGEGRRDELHGLGEKLAGK